MSKLFRSLTLLTITLLLPFQVSLAEPSLFTFGEDLALSASEQKGAIRTRKAVRINSEALKQSFKLSVPGSASLKGKPKSHNAQESFSGHLIESFTGTLVAGDSSPEGDYTLSRVTNGVGRETWSGTLRSPDGKSYAVKGSAGESLMFSEIDTSQQLDCGGSVKGHNHEVESHIGLDSTDGPTTQTANVRVLVAYEPTAVTLHGSVDALLAHIATMVQSANLAYQNSQTGVTITLAGTYALSEPSASDFFADLYAATDPINPDSDPTGRWDELATLRETYCADMVSVIVGNTADNICGLAWIPGTAGNIPNRSDLMYSIVSAAGTDSCSEYTFAHELGHNFGSDHDIANSSNATTAFSYSKGWHFTGDSNTQYATVMAYTGGTRIRVPYFSNPDISYDGAATGDATLANNAASILSTAPIVAAFMAEGESCTSDTPITPPANEPDKVELTAFAKSTRSSRTKISFELYATRLGSAFPSAPLELRYDKKRGGAFTKVIKRVTTKVTGLAKYTTYLDKLKNGYYRACYIGSTQTVCSDLVSKRSN